MILKALITIRREMGFNAGIIVNNLNRMKDSINEDKNISTKDMFKGMNNAAWAKFNHELVSFELKDEIDELTYFYSLMILKLENDFTTKKRLKEILEQADRALNILDKNIEFIKNQISKLKKKNS